MYARSRLISSSIKSIKKPISTRFRIEELLIAVSNQNSIGKPVPMTITRMCLVLRGANISLWNIILSRCLYFFKFQSLFFCITHAYVASMSVDLNHSSSINLPSSGHLSSQPRYTGYNHELFQYPAVFLVEIKSVEEYFHQIVFEYAL